ncbi:hypothetical protein COLO4_32070 [Corchorus olitorius]|uniref:Uncharacterized protein n=1 Tax=Corchorus olitorius TaxID=93759 RepID=A0A1R3H278_9ROSI|nr:hypothetical protein COLO4_32070 [Corchorus olitorius]
MKREENNTVLKSAVRKSLCFFLPCRQFSRGFFSLSLVLFLVFDRTLCPSQAKR